MLSTTAQIILAFLAGPLLHWSYFIRGERDLEAASIARVHLIIASIIAFVKCQQVGYSIGQAVGETVILGAIYSGSLFSSISLYRLILSPLCIIPGPFSMRISKLVHTWILMDNGKQNYKVLHNLRSKYGDIVRTGPNEVTLFGSDAYHIVHGTESTCTRAAYYDILHPMVSLDTTRDPATHASRRKLWDQAFSIKAIETNEGHIYRYATELVKQLRKRTLNSLDFSAWMEYYTFDLMGSLGLTIEFDNMTNGEHPILSLWHIAHRMLGPFACTPWVKHLLMGIPFIERIKYYRVFMQWAGDELGLNIKNNKEDRKNIIGYVLKDAEEHGGIKKNWNFVLGDFVLVVAAGSDPVRDVLTYLFYYLTIHPEDLLRVREELSSIDVYNYKALQRLVHLNACIYEILRLNPAVPTAGLRLPPKGGITINNTFIPEGTTLVTPQYSLSRGESLALTRYGFAAREAHYVTDETCFTEPGRWLPERFSTKPELIRDKNAFVPWSTGKMACLGKNLSLMEIRVAAALLLAAFDFEFAPEEDGKAVFDNASDFFTITPGPLKLVLKDRDI